MQQDSDTTRCSATSEDTPAPSVEGWEPIETAPKDGSSIRVRHDRGTYCSPVVVGCWDRGNWHCSEAFIDPDTRRIYMQPTHWRPLSARFTLPWQPQPERVSLGDTSNTDPSPQTTPAQSAES